MEAIKLSSRYFAPQVREITLRTERGFASSLENPETDSEQSW